MNSTEYQVQQLQLWVRELETRMLQLEDRVVFSPPAQPEQGIKFDEGYWQMREARPAQPEPAFHGFMIEEECCVNICYTPWAPGGPNNELPTAYYTQPPQRKPLPAHEIVTMYDECPTSDSDMIAFARAVEAAHGIKEST